MYGARLKAMRQKHKQSRILQPEWNSIVMHSDRWHKDEEIGSAATIKSLKMRSWTKASAMRRSLAVVPPKALLGLGEGEGEEVVSRGPVFRHSSDGPTRAGAAAAAAAGGGGGAGTSTSTSPGSSGARARRATFGATARANKMKLLKAKELRKQAPRPVHQGGTTFDSDDEEEDDAGFARAMEVLLDSSGAMADEVEDDARFTSHAAWKASFATLPCLHKWRVKQANANASANAGAGAGAGGAGVSRASLTLL